ncbi:MAG: alpha-L-fucosidase [Gemmatimonadetes bacterium]|nr:alpha-L-fucosidase [Gemmatimonadota bacterium]
MDRRDFLALGAAGLAGRALRPSWLVPADVAPAGVPASTTADRMQWWRDARFGMFVHLGLYSVPGGEWKGKFVGSHEWMRNNAKVPHEENLPGRQLEPDGARRRRHRAHGQGGGAAVRGGHHRTTRASRSGRVR